MFAQMTKCTFEGSPMEILRRYAPYLVGAGVAVGVVASLYYAAFTASDNFIGSADTATTGTISRSDTMISGALNRVTPP